MSDSSDSHVHDRPDEEPTTEELAEPSTEKEPGEEPKAPEPHDPAPSHHAVGIGVIDGPDEDLDAQAPDSADSDVDADGAVDAAGADDAGGADQES